MFIKSKKDLKEFIAYEKRLYGNKSACVLLPRFSEQGLIWKYVVCLGMNVTIIGEVTIASKIAIGAGSVVTKNFLKKNVTIAGNPNDNVGNEFWGEWQNKFGKQEYNSTK